MSTQELEPDRRSQLLRAAEQVFTESGYHAARVEDVARAAGVAKGTVYMYFESKEHLFDVLLSETHGELVNRVVGGLSRGESGEPARHTRERLEHGLMSGLHYLSEREGMVRIFLEHSAGVREPIRKELMAQRERMIRATVDCIKSGIEAGEVREVDPQVTALLYLSLLMTLTMERVFHARHDGHGTAIWNQPDRLVLVALDLFFDGIRAS